MLFYVLFTCIPSTQVLYIFFATPQARFFYVLGSSGLQSGHGAVPSVMEQWWATGRLFVTQSLFAVSALSPAVLLFWGLGEKWGWSSYVWGMDRWESMILWRISSSQETKLSHLCPGAIRALSPGPARAPASQSPKPHQRQPFVHHASHWTQEVGGLDLGEKVLRVSLSETYLQCYIALYLWK